MCVMITNKIHFNVYLENIEKCFLGLVMLVAGYSLHYYLPIIGSAYTLHYLFLQNSSKDAFRS